MKFVKHFGELYGIDRISYNVHALIHLSDEAKLHGPLDKFSAFPFESYLYKLKKLVRKPSNILQQIVQRLAEERRAGPTKLSIQPDNTALSVSRLHFNGPVHDAFKGTIYSQYKMITTNNITVAISKPDNCVRVRNYVVLVKNIIQQAESKKLGSSVYYIVYQRFHNQEPFFTYPLPSADIDIHKVSALKKQLYVTKFQNIKGKYLLLPYKACFIATPIMHTFVQ